MSDATKQTMADTAVYRIRAERKVWEENRLQAVARIDGLQAKCPHPAAASRKSSKAGMYRALWVCKDCGKRWRENI